MVPEDTRLLMDQRLATLVLALLLALGGPSSSVSQESRISDESRETIRTLLAAARVDLQALRLSTPPGNNALERYRQVLALEPHNQEARRGIDRIVLKYLELARSALRERRYDEARSYILRAERIQPEGTDKKAVASAQKLKSAIDRAEFGSARRAEPQLEYERQKQHLDYQRRKQLEAERLARLEAERRARRDAERRAQLERAEAGRSERGDGAAKPIVGLAPVSPPKPRYHSWAAIVDLDEAEHGYGMYTYVLFARRLESLRPTTAARYEQLIRAIVTSTRTEGESRASSLPLGKTNIFYIPHHKHSPRPNDAHDVYAGYNTKLSMTLIGTFARQLDEESNRSAAASALFQDVSQQIRQKPGPFLISTFHPIGSDKSSVGVLYADLTEVHPQAMVEIVKAYKTWVAKPPSARPEPGSSYPSRSDRARPFAPHEGAAIESSDVPVLTANMMAGDIQPTEQRMEHTSPSIEEFESFRISLLSKILNFDDNIRVLRIAVADWIPKK